MLWWDVEKREGILRWMGGLEAQQAWDQLSQKWACSLLILLLHGLKRNRLDSARQKKILKTVKDTVAAYCGNFLTPLTLLQAPGSSLLCIMVPKATEVFYHSYSSALGRLCRLAGVFILVASCYHFSNRSQTYQNKKHNNLLWSSVLFVFGVFSSHKHCHGPWTSYIIVTQLNCLKCSGSRGALTWQGICNMTRLGFSVHCQCIQCIQCIQCMSFRPWGTAVRSPGSCCLVSQSVGSKLRELRELRSKFKVQTLLISFRESTWINMNQHWAPFLRMSVCSEPRLRRLIVTINLSFKMETEYCWMLKWMLKSKHKIFKFWNMWWVVTSRDESWRVVMSDILAHPSPRPLSSSASRRSSQLFHGCCVQSWADLSWIWSTESTSDMRSHCWRLLRTFGKLSLSTLAVSPRGKTPKRFLAHRCVDEVPHFITYPQQSACWRSSQSGRIRITIRQWLMGEG